MNLCYDNGFVLSECTVSISGRIASTHGTIPLNGSQNYVVNC